MTVEWKGLEDFAANIEKGGIAVKKKLGFDILAEATKMTPVDTGRLRAGWKFDHDDRLDGRWEISNPVEYAVHVEFGTPKMAARLMLTRAVQRVMARFDQIVRSVMR
ncbi:hypothetical protein Sp245p_28905 (plasmid) [Azospirillum baldaniorum]|uniref:Uncharacterized protein n=1 Tax=Azospirillum baldaniorum TaxID=1064539 RepID=A0A9P1NQJ6_9PROT|nr:HK97 gp10 family phage protein [Azospirillum baldaniorum]AWJ93842.1 hypothetical protein Sp245p_28905 [Azospirillum baldaniorum]TWA81666.1 bacteriophage HK97-gp10 putative tail-component [Azospirillum brasilense]CCD02002.1 protein of unknown function [Azospirillum baldaniorum]